MLENSDKKIFENEFTGAGSTYRVFQWHKKQEQDASGQIPFCIKPEPVNDRKNKKSLN